MCSSDLASRLTMTLVTSGEVGFRLQLDRLRTALVDLGVVSVSALLVSLVTGGGWLACMGVLWAVYLTVGTVVLGESVGAWLFRRLSRRVGRLRGDTNERQVASVPAVSVRSAASSEISFPVLVAESVTATDLPRETSIH